MSEAIQPWEDIALWRKAHMFVFSVYGLSGAFPEQEKYSLALQIRRSAVSIAANISEAFRRHSETDKSYFFGLALADVEECSRCLRVCETSGYGDTSETRLILQEISVMLGG